MVEQLSTSELVDEHLQLYSLHIALTSLVLLQSSKGLVAWGATVAGMNLNPATRAVLRDAYRVKKLQIEENQ